MREPTLNPVNEVTPTVKVETKTKTRSAVLRYLAMAIADA
jgi:hypothetical protein